jgi:hypothetical protein
MRQMITKLFQASSCQNLFLIMFVQMPKNCMHFDIYYKEAGGSKGKEKEWVVALNGLIATIFSICSHAILGPLAQRRRSYICSLGLVLKYQLLDKDVSAMN